MIRDTRPKKRARKSTIKSTKIHETMQKACIFVGLLVVIGIIGYTSVEIHAYIKEESKSKADVSDELEYAQSIYDRKKQTFDDTYNAFLEQYDNFLYSAYIVETASTVYYNDKAVQEMYANLDFLREDAEKLCKKAQLLNQTFITVEGKEDKNFPHLTNTLHTDNTKELEKLTVELKDLTKKVDNSIVNVDFFNGFIELHDSRKEIVETAESMLGLITYKWGGKATAPGWNSSWDFGGGLDCSGFVQWVYWTATGNYIEEIGSTYIISRTQQKIGYNELKPGDLGLMFEDGSHYLDAEGIIFYSESAAKNSNKSKGYEESVIRQVTNHVGIYAGKDKNGKDIWIHCTGGSKDTVVKDNFSKFTCFYRILE